MSIPTYRTNRTGEQVSDALQQMNERIPEGWAVGAADGVPVSSGSPFWHNNAKYYAEEAGAAAARAEAAVPAGTEGAVFFTVDQSDIVSEAQKAVVRKNIRAGGSNPNLLDNWYFVGGGSQLGDGVFPINQRGQTSYTAQKSFDRWTVDGNVTVTLQSGNIRVQATAPYVGLYQAIPMSRLKNGETYTFSIILDGNMVTQTFVLNADGNWNNIYYGDDWYIPYVCANGVCQFKVVNSISSFDHTIKAVKIEKGTVSTLANDPPPDFGEELRKCQRYFVRFAPKINSRAYIGTGSANNSNNMLIFVPTPATLRATPTVSFSMCNCYNWVAGGSIGINAINLDSWSDNGVFVSCVPADTSQAPQGEPYALRVASGGFFDLSCEL